MEEHAHARFSALEEATKEEERADDPEDDEEELPEDDPKDNEEDDEDGFDEDKLTEESYRTTFDTNPEDLEMQAAEVGDDDDF